MIIDSNFMHIFVWMVRWCFLLLFSKIHTCQPLWFWRNFYAF